jgi:hypothetical protein
MKFDNVIKVGLGADISFLSVVQDSVLVDMSTGFAVRNNACRYKAASPITITGANATIGDSPTGSPVLALLKKNGVNVADIYIAPGANIGTVYNTGTTDPLYVTGEVNDVFSLDITQVGSIKTGNNLKVQLVFEGKEAGPILEYPPIQSLDERILITSASESYTSNNTYDITGYWSGFNDLPTQTEPASADGGSISTDTIQNGLIVQQAVVFRDHGNVGNADEYYFSFAVEGAGLAQDLFDSLTVFRLGVLLSGETSSFVTTDNLRTYWRWNISAFQYNQIIADGGISVEINNQNWTSNVDLVLLPTQAGRDYAVSGRDYKGFSRYFNNFHVGACLNTDTQIPSYEITAIDCYSPVNSTLGGDDKFRIQLNAVDIPKNIFGCVRIPNFADLASDSATLTNNASNSHCQWEWDISKFANNKSGLNFPVIPTVINLDLRSAVFNKRLTVGRTSNATQTWAGYVHPSVGHSQLTGDSIQANDLVNGVQLGTIIFYQDTGSNTRLLYLSLRQTGLPQNHFDYIEIKGVGRFYTDNLQGGNFQPTFLGTDSAWVWPIGQELFNSANALYTQSVVFQMKWIGGTIPAQTLTNRSVVTGDSANYDTNGVSRHDVYGFWRNWYETFNSQNFTIPAPDQGGTIDSPIHIGLDTIEVIIYRNYSNTYTIRIVFEGERLSFDLFDSIYVHRIGTLLYSSSAKEYSVQGETIYSWTITADQYDLISNDGFISVEMNNQAWYSDTDLVILPASAPVNLGTSEANGFVNYPTIRRIGAAINTGTQGVPEITAIGCYSSGSPTLGATGDKFWLQLHQQGLTNSDIGAIRIPGWGTYSSQTASIGNAGSGQHTDFTWDVSKYKNGGDSTSKHAAGNNITGLAFPTNTVQASISTEIFSANTSITTALNTSGATVDRKGYSALISGIHPAMGAMLNGASVNGRLIKAILVKRDRNTLDTNIEIILSGNVPLQSFNYMEISNIGRYYAEDAVLNYYSSQNVTRFFWRISSELYDIWPSSGTVSNIQVV